MNLAWFGFGGFQSGIVMQRILGRFGFRECIFVLYEGVLVVVLVVGGSRDGCNGFNLDRFVLAPEGTVQAACQQNSDQLYDSQSDTDAGQNERL